MSKEDKKFNLKGLLLVILIVNVFLALAAYLVDLFFSFKKKYQQDEKNSKIFLT